MAENLTALKVTSRYVAALAAQDPAPQEWRVRVLEPGPESGLELLPPNAPDGLVSQLSWTPPGSEEPIVVTLLRPAETCVAAVTADGNGLVVLAGGVRDSLDLWLVDRREPRPHVLPTSGGRRLPESFNSGLGSWPLVEGPDLVLFAFVKEGRTEFWALW